MNKCYILYAIFQWFYLHNASFKEEYYILYVCKNVEMSKRNKIFKRNPFLLQIITMQATERSENQVKCSNVAGIMCPIDWDRVNWFATLFTALLRGNFLWTWHQLTTIIYALRRLSWIVLELSLLSWTKFISAFGREVSENPDFSKFKVTSQLLSSWQWNSCNLPYIL